MNYNIVKFFSLIFRILLDSFNLFLIKLLADGSDDL